MSDLGEEALVGRLIASLPDDASIVVGAGDDCAVVDLGGECWQLLKTDCLIEGVHFLPGTDPAAVGRKAINRVLSDIAAMGGRPLHGLVTLAVDGERSLAELDGWYEGINESAAEFGCLIVGGETARLNTTGAMFSVAMTGEVLKDRCVTRSGAQVGDLIVVTGKLGGSYESGRHLSFTPRLREAQWLARHHRPTAMMDLSDGLGSDLPRLAKMSGLGFRIDEDSIPCHESVSFESAVRDGEDYELLMTISPDVWGSLLKNWNTQFSNTLLTPIGEMTNQTEAMLPRGWEHFHGE
mgnify:CR=1 FL=1